jgi:hypothetical protein
VVINVGIRHESITSLKIAKSTGLATWEEAAGDACGFTSYPSSGTTYILGILIDA